MIKNCVLISPPNAGLGNQLFAIMNGLLYAKLNSIDYKYINLNFFNIGPYLRFEKSKRKYSSYFIFSRPFYIYILYYLIYYLLVPRKNIILNKPNCFYDYRFKYVYLFNNSAHWSDYFLHLKDHRKLVIDLFFNILNEDLKKKYIDLSNPIIGVHIRRGDFLTFQGDDHFRVNGNTKTPDFYFIDIINKIREYTKKVIPVKVFSDGYKSELNNILNLENIELIENNNDMLDLLHLSKSQLIITSTGSTFSYWAAFLSNATVLIHEDHIHKNLRDFITNSTYYEGPYVDPSCNSLLKSNLDMLAKNYKEKTYA